VTHDDAKSQAALASFVDMLYVHQRVGAIYNKSPALCWGFYPMTGVVEVEKATRHFQEDLWPLDPSKAPRCAPLRLIFVLA
jgi:hypothetical protein